MKLYTIRVGNRTYYCPAETMEKAVKKVQALHPSPIKPGEMVLKSQPC